jgi:carbonic anhydrase
MSRLEEILAYNREFVNNKGYEPYIAGKYPKKELLVVTCMDTRLVELLPKALNLKNGDAKVVKTAGALVTEPYGSVMRSILVGVTLLKAKEIFVIGHKGCGMEGLEAESVLEHLERHGVTGKQIEAVREQGVDLHKWLAGCSHVEEGVMNSIQLIQNHPLLPPDILVHGLIIDPETGELELIHDGRK